MFKSLFKSKDELLEELRVADYEKAKLEERLTILADALDHIERVARKSRTQTNRYLWISARAAQALSGLPYNQSTLPKYPTMCNKKK